MHQRYIIGSVVVVLLAFGAAVMLGGKNDEKGPSTDTSPEEEHVMMEGACRDFAESHITINDQEIHVALADTKEEHAQGLSGCEFIPEGSGMYFVFEKASGVIFWMKDMAIPIDIVWVKDGKIIGIVPNVQPEPGVADEDLARYKSPDIIDGVLELPVGASEALGLTEGQEVAF